MNKLIMLAKISMLLAPSALLAQEWTECSLGSEAIGPVQIDEEDRTAVKVVPRKSPSDSLRGKLVCKGHGGRMLEGEVKDSRLEGKVFDYSSEGSKNYKLTQYRKGAMHAREFYEAGELVKRISYEEGKLYDETTFQKDGSKTYRACPKSTEYCAGRGSIHENADGHVTSYDCDRDVIGNKRIDKFCGFHGPSKVELYGHDKKATKESEHTLVRGEQVGATTSFYATGKIRQVRIIDSDASVHYNEGGKVTYLRCPDKAVEEPLLKKLCGFGHLSPTLELVGYDRKTESHMLNGRLQGDYTERWMGSGKLKTQAKMENGFPQGEKRELTPEGKLVSVSFFQKPTRPYQRGQEFQVQNGWVKKYNAEETLVSEEIIADCRPQKISKFYDNGKPKVVTAFFHDDLKPREEISHYRDDGKLFVTMSMVSQAVTGPVKWFHPDGKTLAALDTYDQGKLRSRKRYDARGEVACLDEFLPDGSRRDTSEKSCGGKMPVVGELVQIDLLPQQPQRNDGGTPTVPPPPSPFEDGE